MCQTVLCAEDMLPLVAYVVQQAAWNPGMTPAHRIEQMGIKRGVFGSFSGSEEMHSQYSFPLVFHPDRLLGFDLDLLKRWRG